MNFNDHAYLGFELAWGDSKTSKMRILFSFGATTPSLLHCVLPVSLPKHLIKQNYVLFFNADGERERL